MEALIIFICSSGISIALMLAIGFLSKWKRPFTFFGFLFIALAHILLEEYFFISQKILDYPQWAETARFTALLIPPLLYFYFTHKEGSRFPVSNYLHFVPSLFYILAFSPLFLASFEFKYCYVYEEVYDRVPTNCPVGYNDQYAVLIDEDILDWFLILFYLAYAVLVFQKRKTIASFKSKKAFSIFQSWGNFISLVIGLVVICQLLDVYFFTNEQGYFSVLYISLSIFFICTYVLTQSIFLQDHLRSKVYDKVKSSEIDIAFRQIKQTILEQEHYTNSSLTLSDIGAILKLPTNKISFILNEKGTNFRDIVNDLRIERAKEILNSKEADNFSLEGIGQKIGYKSKTTFYKHFKSRTGQTPKEYLQKQSNSSNST